MTLISASPYAMVDICETPYPAAPSTPATTIHRSSLDRPADFFGRGFFSATGQSISMMPEAEPPAIANAGSAFGAATGSVWGGRRGNA